MTTWDRVREVQISVGIVEIVKVCKSRVHGDSRGEILDEQKSRNNAHNVRGRDMEY